MQGDYPLHVGGSPLVNFVTRQGSSMNPGKIVPYNVVIDNIIGLTSQAQTELQYVRSELRKYKSLKLTPEQEKYLRSFNGSVNGSRLDEQETKSVSAQTFTKNALIDVNKSVSLTQSDSFLAIRIHPGETFQFNKNQPLLPSQRNSQLVYAQPVNTSFGIGSLPNDNLSISELTSVRVEVERNVLETDGRKCCEAYDFGDIQIDNDRRHPACVECTDATVQTDLSIFNNHHTEVQTDGAGSECALCKTKISSVVSEASSVTRESEDDTNDSESGSDSSSEAETDSEIEAREKAYKEVIIKKDSEIIALKYQLGANNDELEELRELNDKLERLLEQKDESLNKMRRDLKISHEKLLEMGDQRNHEWEDLKQKLYAGKCLIEGLKDNLNKECQITFSQSQDIEKLKMHIKEVTILRSEKEYLTKKIKEMERLLKQADEKIKSIVQEKDELQRQNKEQSCIHADQEDEINRLIALINQMSAKDTDREVKMRVIVDNMRAEIQEKNDKISQCEEQLVCMERKISEFTVKLKNTLNSWDEFKVAYEGIRSCNSYDQDICAQAENALCNLNILRAGLKEHLAERRSLLQQIENLKRYAQKRQRRACSDHDYGSTDSFTDQDASLEGEFEPELAGGNDVVTLCEVKEIAHARSEIIDNETVTVSSGSDDCSDKDTDSWDFAKRYYQQISGKLKSQISVLSTRSNMGEVEKELVSQTSQFFIVVQSLMNMLQTYMESERPSLKKQIDDLRDALAHHGVESIAVNSQDLAAQKQRIYDLYNQRMKEYEKLKPYLKNMPEQFNKSFAISNNTPDTVLYQQLEEILQLEEMFMYDEHVDQVLAIHMKCSIDKIHELSTAIQGAGDQRTEIVKRIEEQQREIQVKDIEIAQLKQQVAFHVTQRGEGDCANEIEARKNEAVKEQLEERVRAFEHELLSCRTERDALKIENRNLDDKNNMLLQRSIEVDDKLQVKNEEIDKLSVRLDELNEIVLNRDGEIKKMMNTLNSLQEENSELRDKLKKANDTVASKSDDMFNLKEEIEKLKYTLMCKTGEHNVQIERKECEIVRLKNENELYNRELKETERRLAEKGETISSLNKIIDEIRLIDNLQENFSRLDKDKEMLEAKVNNLKEQIASHCSNNKKLQKKLSNCLQENELLQNDIDDSKRKCAELSTIYANKASMKDQAKDHLLYLSSKIYERIADFKKRAAALKDITRIQYKTQYDDDRVTKDKRTLIEEQKLDKCKRDWGHEHCIYPAVVSILCLHAALVERERRKEQTVEEKERGPKKQSEEPKRTDVTTYAASSSSARFAKDIEKDQESISSDVELDKLKDDQGHKLQDMRHKLKQLENQNKQKQAEIQKLTRDVESRETDIKNLKEYVNRLLKEKEELNDKLKTQVEEYQSKLTTLKKKYDSGLSALHKRNRENVEQLQARFDDILRGERNPFDSEAWLKTLSLKELTELHNRICQLSSCLTAEDDATAHIFKNHKDPELEETFMDKHGLYEKFNIFEGDLRKEHDVPHLNAEKFGDNPKQQEVNGRTKQRSGERQITDLQNRDSPLAQCQNNVVRSRNFAEKSRIREGANVDAIEKDLFPQLHSCILDYKKDHRPNEALREAERGRAPGSVENNSFDMKRKVFINQCGVYHRLGNVF